jgi:hypothetical protein
MPLQNSNVLWRDLAGEHNSKAIAVLSFPSDFGYAVCTCNRNTGPLTAAFGQRRGEKERIYRFEIFATLEAYLSLIKWALPIFSCWAISPALESSDPR